VVDFSDAGVGSVQMRVNASAATNLEFHADSATGTLLGKCAVSATTGWATQSCTLTTPMTGVHTLYVVFGGAARLNWLLFQAGSGNTTGTGGSGAGTGGSSGTGGVGGKGGGTGGTGTTGAGGTGTGGTIVTGAGGTGTTGSGGTGTTGAGGTGTGGSDTGAGGSGFGGGTGSGGTTPASGGGGCSCDVGGPAGAPAVVLPLGLAMMIAGVRRRRARR
jgi:MYXO-CTERM domain-containing protein